MASARRYRPSCVRTVGVMTDIHIPPEAVEAAARAKYEADCAVASKVFDFPAWDDVPDQIKEWNYEDQRLCITAALKAWPGMVNYRGGWAPVVHNHRKPHLILPLTEPNNV